jgi:hypothetical protein
LASATALPARSIVWVGFAVAVHLPQVTPARPLERTIACVRIPARAPGRRLAQTYSWVAFAALPRLTMDGAAVRELILQLGNSSTVLTKAQAEDAAKLTEICKAFLLRRAKALVEAAGNRAILFTYGADGTPLLAMGTSTAKLPSGRSVVRKAGRRWSSSWSVLSSRRRLHWGSRSWQAC